MLYVGVDAPRETSQITVMDEGGKVLIPSVVEAVDIPNSANLQRQVHGC